jgi:hypothetical protein
VKILLLIAAVGLIFFLSITSFAPFKNALFAGLFPKNSSHATGNGSIRLTPSVTAGVGQTFTTPIMIDTAGEDIVGVDIQLVFDKTVLELTDISYFPENSVLKDYIPGISDPAQKTQLLAQTNNIGILQFSSITLGDEDVFNGTLGESNPFAILQFKVLRNTPTSAAFNHTPGSTIDTNLTGTEAVDILSTVTNMYVNGNPPITYPELSPNPDAKPGDLDNDNKVGIFDYNILLTDFGKTGTNLIADLDKDGKVGIFDYNILLTNFGR